MEYDIDLEIKYKCIEEELINKLIINELNKGCDLGYIREDVLEICDELYKHELKLVFKVNNIENKVVQEILANLWKLIQNCPSFLNQINIYKNKLGQMNLEQSFILMFNYNSFFQLHECIKFMLKKEIDLLENSLIKLEKIL
jgi:hypothetical protein